MDVGLQGPALRPESGLPTDVNPTPTPSSQAQATLPPASTERKRKREKYALRACETCKRRKIKCGGGLPCVTCVRKKRKCTTITADGTTRNYNDGGGPADQDHSQISGAAESSTRTLHDRLSALETHLMNLTNVLLPISSEDARRSLIDGEEQESPSSSNGREGEHLPDGCSAEREGSSGSPRQHMPTTRLTFERGKKSDARRYIGETSVTHVLQRVEDQLTELGVPIVERPSAPQTPPMTPLPSESHDGLHDLPPRHINRSLHLNGIVPNRDLWDQYIEAYLLEIQPLYPLFQEASVREGYHRLWETISPTQDVQGEDTEENDIRVHTLLILANGRCAISNRIETGEGIHSAGWSLYSAAVDLHGNLLDAISDDTRPLQSLQTLTLMVIYLFRLEACERAQKLLSLAVTHAHHLGVHLGKVHEGTPPLEVEMFRRVWWCMYVLDRRVALVLGRPFLIQDVNVSIGLPRVLPEDVPQSLTPQSPHSMQIASSAHNPTSIEYLKVMVGYSRLVGRVWETLYGTESVNRATQPHVREYLEVLVQQWYSSIPGPLLCKVDDVYANSQNDTAPYTFRQRFLIQVRYHYILILTHEPMRKLRNDMRWNDVQSETTCVQLARSIIGMFSQCSLDKGVYAFPCLPYLLDSTITILACVIKVPSLRNQYRTTAEAALKMLNQFFKKTWVSGKTARMIYKLNDIIPYIFRPHENIARSISQQPLDASFTAEADPAHVLDPLMNKEQRLHRRENPTIERTFERPLADLPQEFATPKPNSRLVLNQNYDFMDMSTPGPATQLLSEHTMTSNASSSDILDFQESMTADFPFERHLGSCVSQALVSEANGGWNAGPSSQVDMNERWLYELSSLDSNLLAFTC